MNNVTNVLKYRILAPVYDALMGNRIFVEARMNAEKLEFPDEEFDVVVLNLILSVVENPATAIAEAMRVLKKKGRIMVFDKFLDDRLSPPLARRVLNLITSFIGTDINRRFGDMVKGLPLQVILNQPSIFAGSYRIIITEKS
ncbi:MAG: class I SAM-dependent methyltransferase [Thermincolia bacterium]